MPELLGRRGGKRVHAIVLTRERSDVLERCVTTALSTLGPDDVLTVVDDSSAAASGKNTATLIAAAHCSSTPVTHVRAETAHARVRHVLGGLASWQSKTAPRDIAPLRNLSLVVSTVVDARVTVLIDDDICGFDLNDTYRAVDGLARGGEDFVAGSSIGGASEQDTITKLWAAMQVLESAPRGSVVRVEELFRVRGGPEAQFGHGGRPPISGGYMAFRLSGGFPVAFPPGYNEDWLWGVLQESVNDVHVLRRGTVVHDPPTLRRPTAADLFYELTGDLTYDCVVECVGMHSSIAVSGALSRLESYRPSEEMMPSARAREVLDEARRLADTGYGSGVAELRDYGLGVLEDMLAAGQLEMDGGMILSAWSRDAVVKQASFAATVGDAGVRLAIETLAREGRR